jgi:tRNA uridine 5-carbamoylmethylation protein Kti12
MKSYTELLEGVYDPNIFKAFFMAGGPGSGKSFAVQKGIGQAQKGVKVTAQGLKVVNSDDVFEKYLRDAQLNFKMDANQGKQRDTLRQRAKVVTKKKYDNYVEGRLGMVIDGTGKDYSKITTQAASLKNIGYDVHMIFVNTSLDVALERNARRPRSVPEDIVKKSWNQVQQNIGAFQRFFGNKSFIIVDNNDVNDNVFDMVGKQVRRMLSKKVNNPIAQKWIDNELARKAR